MDKNHDEIELELRSREIEVSKKELDLKIKESTRSYWKNPIVLAVVGAIAAAFAPTISTHINGRNQLALERQSAESARILEMIKTGDVEEAAKNLEFLLETSLLSDGEISSNIAEYLADRAFGTGPVLPSPTR